MKLIASMAVHNEWRRYLPQVISQLEEYCDIIAIYDDASDDGTTEWLRTVAGYSPKIQVQFGPDKLWGNEAGQRKLRDTQLRWAMAHSPTHILSIDADEFVLGYQLIRPMIEQDNKSQLIVNQYDLWKLDHEGKGFDEETQGDLRVLARTDATWEPIIIPLVYEVAPYFTQLIRGMGATKFAGAKHPQCVIQDFNQNAIDARDWVSVLHAGWANPAERAARYQRHLEEDTCDDQHDINHVASINDGLDDIELINIEEVLGFPAHDSTKERLEFICADLELEYPV